jgi:hypothetical protein
VTLVAAPAVLPAVADVDATVALNLSGALLTWLVSRGSNRDRFRQHGHIAGNGRWQRRHHW